MTIAELIDGTIGVDTHRDTLAAAAVTPVGVVLGQEQVTADAGGYRRLLTFGRTQIPGRRRWALEGTGSFGAGLTAFLTENGESVVEVCRVKRSVPRGGRKTDALDAIRAAREATIAEHPVAPRARGEREALRVLTATRRGAVVAKTAAINHLKALIITAPESLRAEVRAMGSKAQISYCARLRDRPAQPLEHRMTVRALRATANRIQALREEADQLEADIATLVGVMAPQLLELTGVGPITASKVLISWSHPGRFRSEAAFAAFSGTSPIPASSGLSTRYRLNRGGDRELNSALHTIALVRARIDPATRAYTARRTQEGKTPREIRRCLKRAIARQLFKSLEHQPDRAQHDPADVPRAA